MTFKPRQYALDAENDVLAHIRTSLEPAVVEATVSFGKSFLIARLAKAIAEMSGKKVLVLCPSGNLVEQNKEKVLIIGEPCSVFSASAGQKSTKHSIVIGTPDTIRNSLSRFDERFSAILIDEGEGLTNSVRAIAERIKEANPRVRIVGFTGTPWRTGEGFVYRVDVDGRPVPEDQAIDPFYTKCIHRCDTHKLMGLGYLTPMIVGNPGGGKYHTANMKSDKKGRFSKGDVDKAYHGHGRLTSQIVADIVAQSSDRAGVMIFAATVKHAKEIMASLPPEISTICVGSGPDAKQAIKDFKAQRKKYIVNVDKLTVGADFPHVDVIAILRKSGSSRLLQQIMGRGVRLLDPSIGNLDTVEERKAAIAASDKPNCLLLDYTEDNFETHFPDGDIWSPVIKTAFKGGEATYLEVECDMCGGVNTFSARKNDEGYNVTPDGYFADLTGEKIQCEHGPIPAHYGRRCLNMVSAGGGRLEQCQQRWTSKDCPHCLEPNDIAARYCVSCKGEIVDPNAVLVKEFKAMKRSPHNRQCDEVVAFEARETVSGNGNEVVRLDFKTPYRSFSWWVQKAPKSQFAMRQLELYQSLNGEPPKTVEYQKSQKSGFYTVYSFGKPADEEPAQ
jgi:DNA repair protein RadD